MISEAHYDAAFQFKKTKLWKKLYDSQLFAVNHSDGTIGYCCVMGMLGAHIALAVYPGEAGMDSYRMSGKDRSALNDFELQEAALAQNCAMLSFENKDELRPKQLDEVRAYTTARQLTLRGRKAYPQFTRYRPHYFPWYLEDEKDQTRLLEALEACLEVSEKLVSASPEDLGFTEGAPFDRRIPLLQKRDGAFVWDSVALPSPLPVEYPSPEARDDIALAKLARAPKSGGEWACDVFMHVDPMTDEESESGSVAEPKSAPFFPYMLLIVDNKSGLVVCVQLSEDPDDYSEKFTKTILEVALSGGKPSRILVCNERTYALFRKLSTQLGAKLVMKKRIPMLEEVEQDFLEHFGDGDDDQMEEQLFDMLRNPDALANMPDEMFELLDQSIQTSVMPDELVMSINRERKRRGMK